MSATVDRLTRLSRRPIVELTPHLDVYWLTRIGAIPTEHNVRTDVQGISLKVPDIIRLACTASHIEAENRIGDIQTINLVWHRPVPGPQALLVCPQCQRPRKTLYCHRAALACRFCHRAVYVSQIKGRRSRPIWQALRAKARHGKVPIGTSPTAYSALAYYGR
jgi:hypothetical protein